MHKKIGGLQAWQWAVIAGLGVALGLYLKHRGGGSSSVTSAAGIPVAAPPTLNDLGSAAAAGGVAPASSGLDPNLEAVLTGAIGALTDQTSTLTGALVGETASSQGLADSVFATATAWFAPPVTLGSSPAGSSPAGTTGAPASTTPTVPVPSSPPPTAVIAPPTPPSQLPTTTYSQPGAPKPVKGPSIFAFK